METLELLHLGGLKVYARPNTSDRVVAEDNLVNQAGGSVFSVEALPEHVNLYRKNLAANGHRRPRVMNAAVVQSADYPTVSFAVNEHRGNFAGSGLYQRWKRPRREITVKTVAFSDALDAAEALPDGGPLCVKLDVEGAELEILEAWDRSNVAKLTWEHHFGVDPSLVRLRSIVQRLEGLGYEVFPRSLPRGDVWKGFRQITMTLWAVKQ